VVDIVWTLYIPANGKALKIMYVGRDNFCETKNACINFYTSQ